MYLFVIQYNDIVIAGSDSDRFYEIAIIPDMYRKMRGVWKYLLSVFFLYTKEEGIIDNIQLGTMILSDESCLILLYYT